MEHVDLDHVQEMATGAGGAENLMLRIRPARPASSWWSRVDLDHVQEIAIGAGGAEHLVPWIRPARPD
ncbi:TPA: hypothetical protein ACSE96_006011 [Pseudomonas aeruginosa]